MSSRTRLAGFALLALSLTALSARAQQTLVVDPTGAGDYLTPAAAVVGASDGDLILVKAGVYNGFVDIIGKSLTIAAEAGAVVEIPSLFICFLTADETVTVRGLDVVRGLAFGSAVLLEDNDGTVWLEDCRIRNPLGSAMNVTRADAVFLQRCTVEQSQLSGATMIQQVDSVVHLFDSQVTGGLGQSGLLLFGSHLFVSGGTITGGGGRDAVANPSGPGCTTAAEAGSAAIVLGDATSTIEVLGATLVGGQGGAGLTNGGVTCPPGANGAPVDGTGTFLAGTARSTRVDGPHSRGESGTLTFEGTPGDLVWFGRSGTVAASTLAKLTGDLVLGLPAQILFLGTIPASGTLNVGFTVPLTLPADVSLVYGQGLFLDVGGGGFVASSGTALVVES